jgi:ribosome-associated toxin RatA of RatAB toxin-antitoxin module
MHRQNTVAIKGDAKSIYALASQVEDWPKFLPHYRRVEILESGVRERLVSMRCVRAFGPVKWPCAWKAKQTLLPNENRILFTHVSGPVRGMEVEWKLEDFTDGVQTTIYHELPGRGLLEKMYAGFIGPVFISAIAGQTLSRIKELVERGEVV